MLREGAAGWEKGKMRSLRRAEEAGGGAGRRAC